MPCGWYASRRCRGRRTPPAGQHAVHTAVATIGGLVWLVRVIAAGRSLQIMIYVPTDNSIETILSSVIGSTGHRYNAKDSAGNTMDTAKIIANPSGGYLSVYHTGNTMRLASSTDLLNWTFRRVLDSQATQPTIQALPTGGFLTAAEYNNQAAPAASCACATTRTCPPSTRGGSTASAPSRARCRRAMRAPRTSTPCH
jgi:hypothetical protein